MPSTATHIPARSHSISLTAMINQIALLFSSPQIPRHVAEREDAILREVVAGHSHGNIFLQIGLFDTEEELDAQFEQVAKIDFTLH